MAAILDWVPSAINLISVILAVGSVYLPAKALRNRTMLKKGIGWQFIRYSMIAAALPLVGMLALQKSLTVEVATIVATALGYAFGQASSGSEDA